jgi:hypothetical protein
MTISGLDKNRFSDRELDALHETDGEHVSTSAVMNKVAADAGYAQGAIRGDDKSYVEMKKDFEGASHNSAAVLGLGAKAAEGAEIVGLHAGAIELAALAAPLVGGIAMLHEVFEAGERGQQLTKALTRDELHVAMLTQLDIPNDFRAEQLAKYPNSGKGWQSGTQKMVGPMTTKDHALMAVVQLHCDQGMNAAREAIDGGDVAAFMKAHPDVAERCAEDPAYKAGFESMRWAKDRKDGDVTYRALTKDLESRDARYDAHHVAWRA